VPEALASLVDRVRAAAEAGARLRLRGLDDEQLADRRRRLAGGNPLLSRLLSRRG